MPSAALLPVHVAARGSKLFEVHNQGFDCFVAVIVSVSCARRGLRKTALVLLYTCSLYTCFGGTSEQEKTKCFGSKLFGLLRHEKTMKYFLYTVFASEKKLSHKDLQFL